jgi:hypothetical protein
VYESETKRGEAKYRQAGMNDVYPTGAMSSPRERSVDTVAKGVRVGEKSNRAAQADSASLYIYELQPATKQNSSDVARDCPGNSHHCNCA